MKLTKELIDVIIRKRPGRCTKEELAAILKLMGFQIKEFREIKCSRPGQQEIVFEIHHRTHFVIEIRAESDVLAISYDNDWIMDNGFVMATENVCTMLLVVLNMLIPKMKFTFKGPQYDERHEHEYDNLEEMQALLEHLHGQIAEITGSDKADEKIQIDLFKVSDVIATIVGEMTNKKYLILLSAVNDKSGKKFTGIKKADGSIIGKQGNLINYSDFLEWEVNVGNLAL